MMALPAGPPPVGNRVMLHERGAGPPYRLAPSGSRLLHLCHVLPSATVDLPILSPPPVGPRVAGERLAACRRRPRSTRWPVNSSSWPHGRVVVTLRAPS